MPPSLPAPDTLFPHKEHKIGFPVITCSPSQHGGSQGVDISSPELPREVPRFFRRGGFKGRFSKLPALPYISSRQLKCVATPRTRGGRASIKERAVLRKILHFVVRCEWRSSWPEAIAKKSTFLHGPRQSSPEVIPVGGVPMRGRDSWLGSSCG